MKACMWAPGIEEGEKSKERVKTQAASKIKASWRSCLETELLCRFSENRL